MSNPTIRAIITPNNLSSNRLQKIQMLFYFCCSKGNLQKFYNYLQPKALWPIKIKSCVDQ